MFPGSPTYPDIVEMQSELKEMFFKFTLHLYQCAALFYTIYNDIF